MKIAFIVQRFGTEVIGGSEALVLALAEKLSQIHSVEILTTCSKNYSTWKNEYCAGTSSVGRYLVRRFETDFERVPELFSLYCDYPYLESSPLEHQNRWIDEMGPVSSSLVYYLRNNLGEYDVVVFFTYLYWLTLRGLPICRGKAVLVPTAHDEPSFKLSFIKNILKMASAYVFLTPEERIFFHKNIPESAQLPFIEVALGINVPSKPDLTSNNASTVRYVLYLGRVDVNKGCDQMVDIFGQFKKRNKNSRLRLVVAGPLNMKWEKEWESWGIDLLGAVSESKKIELIAGAFGIWIPSNQESLSITLLEAWSLSKVVLLNGLSPVMLGHHERSQAGRVYRTEQSCIDVLEELDGLVDAPIDLNGRLYVEKNFQWETVINQYIRLFSHITKTV